MGVAAEKLQMSTQDFLAWDAMQAVLTNSSPARCSRWPGPARRT